MKNIIKNLILLLIIILLISCGNNDNHSQNISHNNSKVKIAGAMSNVMHKGELFGTINLDTISNKSHLYGLGPVEYFTGELLIVDGKSYISKVNTDETISMEESYNVKAPFFVYANVEKWKEINLPDSIQTIQQLETYLDFTTKNMNRPFVFKIEAQVDSALIHIVNLPKGASITSHETENENQLNNTLQDENVILVGFFSTEHQGVFTHHDSYVHIHLITQDYKKMGHLDNLVLKRGKAMLYLPVE